MNRKTPSTEFLATLSRGAHDLGRYRLIAKLGSGGMADVYLALAQGPGGFTKLMVAKFLRPHLAEDPSFLRMFLNEARVAARLSHPHVVQTYELAQTNELHYIVMDYLEGQPLSALLNKTGLREAPLTVVVSILMDALEGLHYAHEYADYGGSPLNIVHRDVSPQNVFITYDGVAKLLDFGIAKSADSVDKTKTGAIKGKYRYMAPEQARGDASDRRADIFSVGVMLWEVLVGRRIGGSTEAMQISARVHGTEPKVLAANPEAHRGYAAICDRAMAHDPADRYATAAELRDALGAELGDGDNAGTTKALVCELFSKERAKLRSLIDTQINRVQGVATADLPNVPLVNIGQPLGSSPSLQRTASDILTAPGTPSALGRSASTQTRQKAAAVPRTLAVAALLGALVALTFWVTYRSSAKHDGPATITLDASAPQAAEDASRTADSREASVDSETIPEVQLTIRATPRRATIWLDARRLTSNPYNGTVPRDGTIHRVRVSAPGYVTRRARVTYDQDRRVMIHLRPRRRPPTPSPQPTQPVTAPRAIDEKDPYR